VFRPDSFDIAYSGNDGGLHRTSNINVTDQDVAWVSRNNGYNTSQFYRIAIDEEIPGNQVLIGGMQDNGNYFTMWSDGETPWIQHTGYDGGHCAVEDAGSPLGYYLYSWQNGPLVRLTVDNATGAMIAYTQFDPTEGGNYLWINPFIMDPVDNHMVFLGTSNGLWRNNDYSVIPDDTGGPVMTNWDHVTTEPADRHISALAISPLEGRVLYFGTGGGLVFRLDGADVAPPGTIPPQLDMGPQFNDGSFVSGIAIHPEDDQKVLLGVSNYLVNSIFYTQDGGATWTCQEGNLAGDDGPSVRDVAILYYEGREIYFAATSTGLYSTFNLNGDGTVWVLEVPDLIGNVVVDDLVARHADGFVGVGTHGKGTYSISVPAGSPAGDIPVARLQLAQNVPNPFNPETTIAFHLPDAGSARLTIYDIRGKLVRTLVDEPYEAGPHKVIWQGDDWAGHPVASGVYLYRLEAGSYCETKRMVLNK
jgi:hypothetical protein